MYIDSGLRAKLLQVLLEFKSNSINNKIEALSRIEESKAYGSRIFASAAITPDYQGYVRRSVIFCVRRPVTALE